MVVNLNKAGEGKVAIFDLDGTLVNTDRYLADDITAAMSRLGVAISQREAVEAKKDWYELARKYGFDKEQLDEAFSYKGAGTWKDAVDSGVIELFPETCEILDSLRDAGVNFGLLSRATRPRNANYKIDNFGLREYFEDKIVIVGSGKAGKTEGALELLTRMPGPIQDAYFIGDREEDVKITREIRPKVSYDTHGLFVDREGLFPAAEGCKSIKSLEEIPGIILI